MTRKPWRALLAILCIAFGVLGAGIVSAKPYELTRNNIKDPNDISSTEISLYRVKLGDPEAKAVDLLVDGRIPGIRAEQEGTFILLWDQRKPTGAMAGVRIMDGKVDLLFINNRFAYKTRGVFRHVLTSESPKQIRELLGKEDYGDENVMGAMLHYEQQGFLVNYLGRDINVEFQLP